MSRLFVLVEGETEETFVNEILAPYLYGIGYTQVSARIMGNARQRSRRGGIRAWSSTRSDLERHLRQDIGITVALMVDYYAMPGSGQRAWPERETATGAVAVETALTACIANLMGIGFDRNRFIPLVMMHEFEAMLFSDCEAFGRAICRPDIVNDLLQIREAFPNPEAINDSPEGAPSKRILNLVPEYNKPLWGNLIAIEIGLNGIRDACPHFCGWLERLEVHGGGCPDRC